MTALGLVVVWGLAGLLAWVQDSRFQERGSRMPLFAVVLGPIAIAVVHSIASRDRSVFEDWRDRYAATHRRREP